MNNGTNKPLSWRSRMFLGLAGIVALATWAVFWALGWQPANPDWMLDVASVALLVGAMLLALVVVDILGFIEKYIFSWLKLILQFVIGVVASILAVVSIIAADRYYWSVGVAGLCFAIGTLLLFINIGWKAHWTTPFLAGFLGIVLQAASATVYGNGPTYLSDLGNVLLAGALLSFRLLGTWLTDDIRTPQWLAQMSSHHKQAFTMFDRVSTIAFIVLFGYLTYLFYTTASRLDWYLYIWAIVALYDFLRSVMDLFAQPKKHA